jgi:hypothetical protein
MTDFTSSRIPPASGIRCVCPVDPVRKKILAAEARRRNLFRQLLGPVEILRGSYALVYTKCGRSNCWCSTGKGHPHPRITWKQCGQGTTRKVPRDQIDWIQKVTANYRRFRLQRREIVAIEATLQELLDQHELRMVETTRSKKSYLSTRGANRKVSQSKIPKQRGERIRPMS